jgi:polyhydroxybutyrate depolymerase
VGLLVLTCALAACASGAVRHPSRMSASAAAGVAPGSSAASIDVGGLVREYRTYRPRHLRRPAQLVVVLHGGGGSAASAERRLGWDAAADKHGFLVAYPQGTGRVRAWNAGGGCCGTAARRGVDDVAFVVSLVKRLRAKVDVEAARIDATGVSNGGMLAYALACRTDLFAAIGPVSATMLSSCRRPRPVSVIAIHGLRDTRVRFGGGPGTGRARVNGPPIPEVISRWRSTDRCTSPGVKTSGPVTTSIADCPDGRAVELITIADVGHGWPGALPAARQPGRSHPAPPTAVDATGVIATFFRAHPGAAQR